MTFSPKKKTSKSRSRRRTTNWTKLSARKLANRVVLQKSESGEVLGLAHFVSPVTGMYKGRMVMPLKSKKKKVTRI